MTTFTIDTDNTITAYESSDQARFTQPDVIAAFASVDDLAYASADWPLSRFPAIWNAFAGAPPFGDLKPVKKFTDRMTALARIWKALQVLTPAPAPQAAPAAPKKAKATKAATPEDAPPLARAGSKLEHLEEVLNRPAGGTKMGLLLEMLHRPTGATLLDLMSATGWQKHTVRGFISTLPKKAGVKIESFKNADKARTYRIVK